MPGLVSTCAGNAELAPLWKSGVDEFILDLAWSPAGRHLAFVTVDGRVFIVDDAETRGHPRQLGSHVGGATAVSWRHDSRELATSGQDGTVRIWEPLGKHLLCELAAGDRWVSKVVYHPRHNQFASAAGKLLRIWSADRAVVYQSYDHESTIADIGWNPDGSSVAAAAYFGITLHIPERRPGPRKYEWKGSSLVLAWSPNSKYIATGEQDSTVHFWNVKTGRDAQMWGFPAKVLTLAWHATGDYLATGGDEEIAVWNCTGKGPENREPQILRGHRARITQVAFQRSGDLLASADRDGTIHLWRPSRQLTPIGRVVMGGSISRLDWSPEGRLLAIGQQDGTVGVVLATV